MYLALIGGLVVLALVVVPITYAQIIALVVHTSDYVAASQEGAAQVERFRAAGWANACSCRPSCSYRPRSATGSVRFSARRSNRSGTILVNTANALLIGVSALILSVFLLARGREIRNGFLGLVPPTRREQTNLLLVEVASIFGHFVAGQLALCVIVGAVVWIALAPSHFAFALLVAVISAFGYSVPFFGMIVAQVVAAALALPQGPGMVIYVTVAIFIIARVADNVLVPKIMGDSVGVSPIGVMFAVFAGGELFGLWGLILGIPAAALVRLLFEYFVLPWIVRMQGSDLPIPEVREESVPTVIEVTTC